MGEIYLYLVHTHYHDHDFFMVFLPPSLHILSCKVRRMEYLSVSNFLPRTALLMTAFLLLINIYNSVVNETPNSDEMTALEVWSLGCISVVFGTILTYAIILSRDQMIIQGVLTSEGELLEESSAHQQKVAWSTQEDKTRLSLKVRNDQESLQTDRNIAVLFFIRRKLRKTSPWSSPCSSWSFSASPSSMLFTGPDQGQDFLNMSSSTFHLNILCLITQSVSQSVSQ